MWRKTALTVFLVLWFGVGTARATAIEIYGAWHCGNDFCTWSTVRDMTDFDNKNHWMIDRGNGLPSVNLVVLSFVNPLKLLNQTNDSGDVNGVPVGMNGIPAHYSAGAAPRSGENDRQHLSGHRTESCA
jgi:hypothetical protein